MKKTLLTTAATVLLLGAGLAPAMAQDAGRTGDVAATTDADRVAVADTRDDDNHDFPWGLLGLLGLAGLIPRKQRTVVHHDTVRTHTNTTGTGTPR